MRSSKAPKADIVAEASAWFIEFRAGDPDRARFYEWLRRSPEHIQAYLEIAEGWAELPTSDADGRIDIEALIRRAREEQDDNVIPLPPRSAPRRQRRHLPMHAWAASVVAVAMLIGLISWVRYETNTYRTGTGEQRTVRLADGSTIEINALSKVRVRLSESVREVDLDEGQALFQVAKDPKRPFMVRSGEATVRAVGTRFDVYKKRSGTVITVLEGRVAVAEVSPAVLASGTDVGIAKPIFLAAGEQVTVPEKPTQETDVKPKRADVAAATAWVHKRLIFDETPLADVAEEFNRYSTRRLVIVDPELRTIGVSGVYSSIQPDLLLAFLRAQPDIQLSETDEEIRVALATKK
jgi:transmembrane sensor